MAVERTSLMWLFSSIGIIGGLGFMALLGVQGWLGNIGVAIVLIGAGIGYYYAAWEMNQ